MERPSPATRWRRKCWSEEQRVGEPGGASFPAAGPPRGCAERPVQTAVVFLLLFSLLLRIQDPGAREDQKLNPVATPGSIKPSLRGTRLPGRARETRELSKVSCRVRSAPRPQLQPGAPAALPPAKAPDPSGPTKSSRPPYLEPDRIPRGRSSRAKLQRVLREPSG